MHADAIHLQKRVKLLGEGLLPHSRPFFLPGEHSSTQALIS